MFTGIIHHIGTITSLTPKEEGFLVVIKNSEVAQLSAVSHSVAISGVCLTVIENTGDELTFEVGPETLRKTTLGKRQVGDKVNMETSLRAGDEIGGHFVYGHVDAVGEVVGWEPDGDTMMLTIKPPKDHMKYFAPQGSVSIDGVSLTVARLNDETFGIMLLEYTLTHTTLSQLSVGSAVNIEVDMMIKYMERVAEPFSK